MKSVVYLVHVIFHFFHLMFPNHIFRQQDSDEMPMVWEMLIYLYVLYYPNWHYRSTMATFLFIYGVAFATFHSLVRFSLGFKVYYVFLCLLCIPRVYKYYMHTKNIAGEAKLAHLYVATIGFGSLCWLFDRTVCKEIFTWYINPQGHALWHLFMGFNFYFANTFLMFCRAQQLGWSPQVCYFLGLLPYVKIKKPKTR